MTRTLEVPALLSCPPLLTPLLAAVNDYRYFVIEGGRGSAKSQTVARLLLHIADQRRVRVVCGRETQNRIDESVYTLLSNLIRDFSLNYDVLKTRLDHKLTASTFAFRGFRELGAINVQGMEDVDILWVDEAQALGPDLMRALLPTIRKDGAKLIFTMNRLRRNDAVIEALAGRPDCLHLKINYSDNPFCPASLKAEAEELRARDERMYRHVWLGEPIDSDENALFSTDKLYRAYERPHLLEPPSAATIMAFDVAAGGGDYNVASLLTRVGLLEYELTAQTAWAEADTMATTGRIAAMLGEYEPDVAVIDADGLGKVIYDRLVEVGAKIQPYRGGATEGVDLRTYANTRAYAYCLTRDWFETGRIVLPKHLKQVVRELELINYTHRSNGAVILEAKEKMAKSPDHADSLVMAVWAAQTLLGKSEKTSYASNSRVRVIAPKKRHRR